MPISYEFMLISFLLCGCRIAPGKPTLRCSAATLSKLNFVCPQLFPMVSPESKIPQYENLVDGIKQQVIFIQTKSSL